MASFYYAERTFEDAEDAAFTIIATVDVRDNDDVVEVTLTDADDEDYLILEASYDTLMAMSEFYAVAANALKRSIKARVE